MHGGFSLCQYQRAIYILFPSIHFLHHLDLPAPDLPHPNALRQVTRHPLNATLRTTSTSHYLSDLTSTSLDLGIFFVDPFPTHMHPVVKERSSARTKSRFFLSFFPSVYSFSDRGRGCGDVDHTSYHTTCLGQFGLHTTLSSEWSISPYVRFMCCKSQ